MIQQEFATKEAELAMACLRIADALNGGGLNQPVANLLASIGQTLCSSRSWEEKAAAASSIRSLFHRGGIADQPPLHEAATWEQDIKTLSELATIHIESRYRSVRFAEQAVQADGRAPGAPSA